MRILCLGGSIRSSPTSRDALFALLDSLTDLDHYIERAKAAVPIPQTGARSPGLLSNTEVCAGAALLAARNAGAEIDFFPLSALFPRRQKRLVDYDIESLGLDDEVAYYDFLDVDPGLKEELCAKIRWADGIILCSPVYFGDRSSVSNKVMQFALREGLFQNKIVGCISAGAKRNGGQETTNIFHLSEALSMGAFGVGNGPACAQYGGTVVAGDLGTAAQDSKGLQSCYGVGKRVAECASLFRLTPTLSPTKKEILVVIAMDTPDRYVARIVSDAIRGIQPECENVTFNVAHLLDGDIERCVACNICPIPELLDKDSYGCILKNQRDEMRTVRELMLAADGIIIAGLNLRNMANVIYRYQAFTERTRVIRRNDFELTNLPLTSFTVEEVGAKQNPIFGLKVMVSYLRHNTILCPPIREIWHEGRKLCSGEEELLDFVNRVSFLTDRRRVSEGIAVSYKAGQEGGYRDDRLDHTQAIRF